MKSKESVYKQCASALDLILEDEERGSEVFTEIDVITDAATGDWKDAQYTEAVHAANEVCGLRYRSHKLCRYGPVKIGRGKNRTEDYARYAGKIVYADAVTGPKTLKTPNGTFRKLMVQDDRLSRQGRKPAANRDDGKPWSEQTLPSKPRKPVARKSNVGLTARDSSLEKTVADLLRRVDSLEKGRAEEQDFFAKQAKQRTAA